MSDAIVHALVRARRSALAADAARCRATPHELLAGADRRAAVPPRDATLTTHGALRDYLTAI